MKKAMEPEVVATSSKIKFEDSDEHDSSSEDVRIWTVIVKLLLFVYINLTQMCLECMSR